ncbi:TatD family hydrolase [Mariniblastus fucicola]|uniref:Putative deoxyribonuclease YjjV n=1 Tax=Mariniblastus fucicola TaxID=980251 RepID=A0A5B9PIU5_9BACT|nr:TatD family hydrolase [Mariniblastus fucicola]QEG25205.1 putative deoxyribonuclease YjjV [Mariniblastus fucicola]
MIDSHNHLQDARFDGHRREIVSVMRDVGVSSCVVNGTEESDWSAVAKLAETWPEFVRPSFGVHPWKVQGRAESWLESLRGFLDRFPDAGVGEIGLDRWIEGHDIEDQLIVFRNQLDLAVELDRPCTIHCLRAWGPLLKELTSHDVLPRFLMHSFGGSEETAKKFVELGAWFSFSGYFLHEKKEKVVEVFRSIPQDRILVETDAPDMLPPEKFRPFGDDTANHPANLARISERLAELLDIEPEQLVANTNRWWFGKTREAIV